jgi:hypothetical protein
MTQALYAHMNKIKIKKKKTSLTLVFLCLRKLQTFTLSLERCHGFKILIEAIGCYGRNQNKTVNLKLINCGFQV